MQYYNQTAAAALTALESSRRGLSSAQAARRLQTHGPNELKPPKTPLWRVIIEPFADIFMCVLAVAAGLSLWHKEFVDAAIIGCIMLVNAGIFYIQTASARRVLRALRDQNQQQVTVTRDGREQALPASQLVPGDIVHVSEGEKIPADGRLIQASSLRINESQLTGESNLVAKTTAPLTGEVRIDERTNMLYQGSFVAAGSGSLVVSATGNATEFGTVAGLAARKNEPSPIQQKIDALIRQIIMVVLGLSAITFGLALLRGMGLVEALRFVLAMAVSAVPESLPIAISVVLVLGMRRMAGRKALVQTMRSIEAIGAITTIATDKTGTLTYNKLALEQTWEPRPGLILPAIARSITQASSSHGTDPLDSAMATYLSEQHATPAGKPHTSYPFSQERALSANLWQTGGTLQLAVKGAPEQILAHCRLSHAQRRTAQTGLNQLTAQGYRVIGLAHTQVEQAPASLDDVATLPLQLDGFIAVADQLRPEAKRAITQAQQAGVTVRMITGDHVDTAFFIAQQLGMATRREQVFDSRRIDDLGDDELAEALADVRVFARVLPEQKYRILQALKQRHITAMTGDGVNDVPALRSAHVGLSMGSGASIARETGDIILLDDNFSTIITAMREGRTIISNIRRMLYYLLGTNAGEMLTMLISLLCNVPLPLVPVQILWVNLVTDSCLVIPLGLEPEAGNVLTHKPIDPRAPLLPRSLIVRMVLTALTMALVTTAGFSWFMAQHDIAYARTIAFNLLVIMQLASAFSARSDTTALWVRLRTPAPLFYLGLGIALALHAASLATPLGSQVLHLAPVTLTDLAWTSLVAIMAPIIVSEAHKWYCRTHIAAASTA